MIDNLLPPQGCESPYSVSEINGAIANRIESGNCNVWVEGEVAGFKQASSGHCYFRLIDDESQIQCVIWASTAARQKIIPEDGMQVALIATIRTYLRGGNYQLDTQRVMDTGAGAMAAALDKLRKKLEKEGLFDISRKENLPDDVKRLGVVTSASGAAIRDIIRVTYSRDRGVDVILRDVPVQGDAAPAAIALAIAEMNLAEAADVLIVGRGGGSADDLWAFNDERVVRAIAASRIPVISAVGHEIDVTLSDFAADVRAATPSAAAEIAVADVSEILRRSDSIKARFAAAFKRTMNDFRDRLTDAISDPAMRRPAQMILEARMRLDESELALESGMNRNIERCRERIAIDAARLSALSPLSVLSRGYAAVYVDEKIISSSKKLRMNDKATIRFADGSVSATIDRCE